MKVSCSLIAFLLLVARAFATNYYLSNKGSDLQSGTSTLAPWSSLKKLSDAAQSLQPGDSIFFERGSIFVGEVKISALGRKDKEIYIGAYGSGPKPIVSGAIRVEKWAPYQGNIWVGECLECNAEIGNLFIDGYVQPLGRYPNKGYLTLSCASQCKTTLTDNHLTFGDGYWDGAEVVVKSSRWTLDNLTVLNFFNKVFYFSSEASYPLTSGFGYFIQKHPATLDTPGEWYFDKKSKKIYLYFQAGDKPFSHSVDASDVATGLTILNSSFITIENIKFNYQRTSGVHLMQSADIRLQNCEINYSGNNGVEVVSCQRPIIENCKIGNSNNNGVQWIDNTDGAFLRSSILRTGLRAGRGGSGNGTYIGLSISSSKPQLSNNLFQNNVIDSTGYIGIDFRTGGTTIKNNMINNFCTIKDDGAGIYTWGNTFGKNNIEGNIVLNGIGCGDGTTDHDNLWASGIYIDDRSSDIDVTDNTVAYCGASGIYIHNAKQISVNRNKLFDNANSLVSRDKGQLCIKLDALVQMESKALDLRISNNLFASAREGNHCVYLSAEKEQDLTALGKLDQNECVALNVDKAVAKFYGGQNNCNALEEFKMSDWQLCIGDDKKSYFKKIPTVGETAKSLSLTGNGQMNYNTEGWMVWPSEVFIAYDKKKGVDRPSLRVQFPSGATEALLYHAGFSLSSNKSYRLTFSAMGATKSKIEFAPLMAKAPWEALDDYACFSVDTVFKSFTYLFKPNKSNNEARLNFKANATFWIDNITLSEVSRSAPTADQPLRLIYNASEKSKTISLSEKLNDLDGTPVSNPLMLPAYSSMILRRPDK